ncbi:SPFH domain-containing protein [Aurantibacillus circumpalustris]|uniref:SPFH domain-containing protein n=1 Tax=Aurantibacillus circumpalustris TaxID=3036359 RepID=UPI00295AAD9B|nr:SPFH domain-containing protein [Aurantibacillus circumpalustris]
MMPIGTILLVVLVIMTFLLSFVTVQQGTIAITTIFGKFSRILRPGLNFKIPFIEKVFKKISVQNRSSELGFQAVTIDQANVNFTAMLLYSVINSDEETIKNVAFKFIDERNFMQALVRSVEGSVRAFVATKKQSEVLILRRDIVEAVKDQLDRTLEEWGYHLIDLQLNDITFDDEVMRSMAKVVASNNLKSAAENEGQALLITRTKAAEAEGNFIKISAQAEKDASQLKGEGIALFRQEVAKGMAGAAKEMEGANLDSSLILFSMWTEAVKNFAQEGKGNVIFLDGSVDGMQKTMKDMMALNQINQTTKNK